MPSDVPFARKFIGLLKFFHDEWKLDLLRSGCFYCNTPEFYRLSTLPGVSDRNENAIYTYRQSYDDSAVQVQVNDTLHDDVRAFTIQRSDSSDAYMHCWTMLSVPETEEELQTLQSDLRRLRQEFGRQYAFIQFNNLSGFIEQLQTLVPQRLWCEQVLYSDKPSDWSITCKRVKYSYQREYRFGIIGCDFHKTTPLILEHSAGFRDFIAKNTTLALRDNAGTEIAVLIDPHAEVDV